MRFKRFFILIAFTTMTVLWVGGAILTTGCEKSRQEGGTEKATSPQKTGAAIEPAEEITGPPLNLVTAIIQVAKSNIPAVVHIEVTERQEVPNPYLPLEKDPSLRRFFGLPKNMPKKFEREVVGVGTGMVIDKDGHILTNNHVVGGANKIQVTLSDGEQYPARVVGTDPKTDLGVIQISVKDAPPPFVTFGDSDRVEVGQWVVAIGQPRNLAQSVTQGIISAKHRTGITDPSSYQDFLQTDTAINPGNSGGPLLNLRGEVIGVNSVILSESGGFEGIGFAIPSNMALRIANQLIQHGKVERGWLGVSTQDVTPELAKSFSLDKPKGALIGDVTKGGPAEKAGLKRGDVILSYGDKEIPDSTTLRNAVADSPVGQEVKVTVWRDRKRQALGVRVGNLEDLTKMLTASIKERLGGEVRSVTTQEAQRSGLSAPGGVVIQSIDPKGPLGSVGFEVGDMILAMDDHPVEGIENLAGMLNEIPAGQKIVLLAWDHRSGQASYVQVKVG